MGYDKAGNLAADRKGYKYRYDYENRPVKITDSDDSTVAEYAYDALGRRIRKIDSAASDTTVYYYNNHWQVVEEYDGGGTVKRKYLYGNYIDEVLYSWGASPSDPRTYYVHDHLYSPVALVNYAGTVVERYEYDVYGKPTIYTAPGPDETWLTSDDVVGEVSAQDNCCLFTGREVDVLDGNLLRLQYNRNRYYDYCTGRWLTQDPLRYVDGLNLYQYAHSIPLVLTDFTGQGVGIDMYERTWSGWIPSAESGRVKGRMTPIMTELFPATFGQRNRGDGCYEAYIATERQYRLTLILEYVAAGAVLLDYPIVGATGVSVTVGSGFSSVARIHELAHAESYRRWHNEYLNDGYALLVSAIHPCGCTAADAVDTAKSMEQEALDTINEYMWGEIHYETWIIDKVLRPLQSDEELEWRLDPPPARTWLESMDAPADIALYQNYINTMNVRESILWYSVIRQYDKLRRDSAMSCIFPTSP